MIHEYLFGSFITAREATPAACCHRPLFFTVTAAVMLFTSRRNINTTKSSISTPPPTPPHPDILIISPKCTACVWRWISHHRKLLACRTDAKFLIDRWRECHVAVGAFGTHVESCAPAFNIHFIPFQANKWEITVPKLPPPASVIAIAAGFHCVSSVSETDFNLRGVSAPRAAAH